MYAHYSKTRPRTTTSSTHGSSNGRATPPPRVSAPASAPPASAPPPGSSAPDSPPPPAAATRPSVRPPRRRPVVDRELTREPTPPSLPEVGDTRDLSPDAQEMLKVASVDLQYEKNSERHHTEDYKIGDESAGKDRVMVLRRGEEIRFSFEFDREYDVDKDDLRLSLTYSCDNPKRSDGTLNLLKPNDKHEELDETRPRFTDISGKTAELAFRFNERVMIGKWKIALRVAFKKSTGVRTKIRNKTLTDAYVIFNPWCQEDPCYLGDENLLDEYINNDSGVIYVGSTDYVRPRPWAFNQFDEAILPGIVSMLLDNAYLSEIEKGNPVLVSRAMAALMNVQDDGGVLVGNWSGDYEDGASPTSWHGSGKILEQYFNTKEPVKYGQCWVFSGLLTTVLRALGIPARSVTNFDSAHDNDQNCVIDKVYDKDWKYLYGDSIWNFHVWNEGWFCRDDLKEGYGGWQAVDATPQESSNWKTEEGKFTLMTCGPASIDAIKHGNINQNFDAGFIFAEVNADVVTWMLDESGEKHVVSMKRNHVGSKISTKMPNENSRLDLTNEYKFPEGSDEEKASVMRAVKLSPSPAAFDKIYDMEGTDDIVVQLEDIDKLDVGKDAVIKVNAKNKGTEKHQVSLGVTVSTMYYSGTVFAEIRKENFDLDVAAGDKEQVKVVIPFEEYWPKTVEQCMFKVYCIGHVKDTNQAFIHEDKFVLKKPDLKIKAPSEVKAKDKFDVEVSFTNPLNITLSKCEFTLEAAQMFHPVTLKHDDIGPGKEASVTFSVAAKWKGKKKKELIASFESKELIDLDGITHIKVN